MDRETRVHVMATLYRELRLPKFTTLAPRDPRYSSQILIQLRSFHRYRWYMYRVWASQTRSKVLMSLSLKLLVQWLRHRTWMWDHQLGPRTTDRYHELSDSNFPWSIRFLYLEVSMAPACRSCWIFIFHRLHMWHFLTFCYMKHWLHACSAS